MKKHHNFQSKNIFSYILMWILLWVGKNDRISRDSLKDTEIRFNVPEKEKKKWKTSICF